jgi:hypothetical protein
VEEQVLWDLIIVFPDAQGVMDVVFVNVLKTVWVFRVTSPNLEDTSFELEDRLNVEVVIQEVSYRALSLV